jgi:hypothetical protein
MKVFLSYGAPRDQITALRIQALAVVAAEDLNVYVPPIRAVNRQEEIHSRIRESDVLVAVASSELNGQVRCQTSYAEQTGIPVFVLSRLPSENTCHHQVHPTAPAAIPPMLERLLDQTGHCVPKEMRMRLTGVCILAAGLLLLDAGEGSQRAG